PPSPEPHRLGIGLRKAVRSKRIGGAGTPGGAADRLRGVPPGGCPGFRRLSVVPGQSFRSDSRRKVPGQLEGGGGPLPHAGGRRYRLPAGLGAVSGRCRGGKNKKGKVSGEGGTAGVSRVN